MVLLSVQLQVCCKRLAQSNKMKTEIEINSTIVTIEAVHLLLRLPASEGFFVFAVIETTPKIDSARYCPRCVGLKLGTMLFPSIVRRLSLKNFPFVMISKLIGQSAKDN